MVGEFIDTIKRGYSFDVTRSDRREYIIFVTGIFLIAFGIGFYGGYTSTDVEAIMKGLTWFVIVPNVMITIRRLHDVGWSGWVFVPIVLLSAFGPAGTVLLIIFTLGLCIMQSDGHNKYGLKVERVKGETVTIDED